MLHPSGEIGNFKAGCVRSCIHSYSPSLSTQWVDLQCSCGHKIAKRRTSVSTKLKYTLKGVL